MRASLPVPASAADSTTVSPPRLARPSHLGRPKNHRPFRLIAGLFSLAVTLLTMHPAFARSCYDLFGDAGATRALEVMRQDLHARFSAQPNALYAVTIKNEIYRYEGTYHSSRVQYGRLLVTLRRDPVDSLNPRFVEFDMNEAHVTPTKERTEEDPIQFLKSVLRMVSQDLREAGGLIYSLQKTLHTSSTVKVFGGFRSSTSKARAIADTIASFDAGLARLGLNTPPQTHVFIVEKPATSPLAKKGPYCVYDPLWSPLRGRSDSTIKMLPFEENIRVVTDPSVIIHERAHSVLMNHYSREAFFNRASAAALQEALADFLAAHFVDRPRMGEASGYVIRDMSANSKNPRARLPLTRENFNADDTNPYYHSLAYSGILWRLREVLGAERISQDLKSILDILSATDGPLVNLFSYGPAEVESANLRHFLAVLAHYYRNDPRGIEVVRAVAEANLFSLEELLSHRSPLSLPPQAGERRSVSLIRYLAATARVAAKPFGSGLLMYLLFASLADDE